MSDSRKKQQRRLGLNILLMILTLLTLISCVVAWFTNSLTAQVDSLTANIHRAMLEIDGEVSLIELPCATKIADPDTTPLLFNTECVDEKIYTIKGEGQLFVSVSSENPELLAYVCNSVSTTDYYAEIMPRLKAILGDNSSTWTFEAIKTAMDTINNRLVGDIIDENTQVKIVYWVEYNQIYSTLQQNAYQDLSYTATITFTN